MLPQHFFSEQGAGRRQFRSCSLVAQVIVQVPHVRRDALGLFDLFVGRLGAAHLEAVQDDGFPVELVFLLLGFFGALSSSALACGSSSSGSTNSGTD